MSKRKFSLEEKEKIIVYYLDGNKSGRVSQQETANEFDIDKDDVTRILQEGGIYNKTHHENEIRFIDGKTKLVNPILRGDE